MIIPIFSTQLGFSLTTGSDDFFRLFLSFFSLLSKKRYFVTVSVFPSLSLSVSPLSLSLSVRMIFFGSMKIHSRSWRHTAHIEHLITTDSFFFSKERKKKQVFLVPRKNLFTLLFLSIIFSPLYLVFFREIVHLWLQKKRNW